MRFSFTKREIHHRLINILFIVNSFLSKQEDGNFPKGQNLPEQAETSQALFIIACQQAGE